MRSLIVVFLLLTACTRESGGGDTDFLLPFQAVDGEYKLEKVTVSTLASPLELRGEAAEVYYQTGFSKDGYQGSIARPHLTKSGGTYIPMNAESGLAIAIYAQFDKLFKYEAKLGTRGQLTWPRKVGIELNMVAADGGTHNNAHYFTSLDAIGVVPYDKKHVPVVLNHGIIAHEHFHAHFQTQVMDPINNMPAQRVSTLENIFYPPAFGNSQGALDAHDDMDQTTARGLNNLILRSWNEGLADLFASIYTRQPDFFSVSLPDLGDFRTLEGENRRLMTSSDLLRISQLLPMKLGHKIGIVYEQGTILARMMLQLSKNAGEAPDKFLSSVMLRLKNVPQALAPDLNKKVLDFEFIVPILLEGYSLSAASCRTLEGTVSSVMMKASFAKCSAL